MAGWTKEDLDNMEVTQAHALETDGTLRPLPWGWVTIAGATYLSPMRTPDMPVPVEDPNALGWRPRVRKIQVMDDYPFPQAQHQPAPDTNTAGGEVAVHYYPPL